MYSLIYETPPLYHITRSQAFFNAFLVFIISLSTCIYINTYLIRVWIGNGKQEREEQHKEHWTVDILIKLKRGLNVNLDNTIVQTSTTTVQMDLKRKKSRIPVYVHKKQSVIELPSTSNGSCISSSSTGSTEEPSEVQSSAASDEGSTGEPSVKSKLRKLETRLNVLKYDNLQREIALEKLSEDMVKRIAALEDRIDIFTNQKKLRSQSQGEEFPQSA